MNKAFDNPKENYFRKKMFATKGTKTNEKEGTEAAVKLPL